MSNKPKKTKSQWLKILYYTGTLLSLCFTMAQVFLARRSMIQASEWEKAKLTIENVERFKENLKETMLYRNPDALFFADRRFPDFTTSDGYQSTDTLRKIYFSLFDGDERKAIEDYFFTLAIMDAFAYPIIMGYASETGSFRSVIREYSWYGNYIMPAAFHNFKPIGHHAKLLNRLWRVKGEMYFLPNWDSTFISKNINNLLGFEDTIVTPATIKQYEKKLEKDLKKIEKEIDAFRKSSLK
jgi:hypothetical protein